jgi:hypothetical protein
VAVADKIIALLDAMTPASLDSLSPVRRRQFADLCRHWADIAEQPVAPAKVGASGTGKAPAPHESESAKPPGRSPPEVA